jgi:hypothetical protein
MPFRIIVDHVPGEQGETGSATIGCDKLFHLVCVEVIQSPFNTHAVFFY